MIRTSAVFLLLVAGAGCGPRVDVHAERSTIATFPRYSTYAWASGAIPVRSPGETDASLVDWRIRNAVDRALTAKGYVRTSGPASLLVDYDVSVQHRYTDSFQDYFAYHRQGGSADMGEAFARGYQEGTVVVHLVDARTRELAYRASATGVVEEGGDGSRLDQAVVRMLADLPPVTDPGTTR